MHSEIELKFSIAASDVARFKKLALLHDKKPRREKLVSTYWDTPDFAILRAGFGLRVRRIGKRRILSLKTAAEAQGGLHTRGEWERPLRPRSAIYTQIDNADFRARVPQSLAIQLGERFVTDVRRTTWDLPLNGGGSAEITLDEGNICAGKRCESLTEVEIELKTGSQVKLFVLAQTLLADIPLRPESRDKAARGYRLAGLEAPVFYKAATPQLDAKSSPATAAHKVLAECLRHIDVNSAGVLFDRDTEALHQMRVAVRRIRAALSLFSEILPTDFSEPVTENLRWLMQQVGPARDWDVFIAQTLEPIAIHYSDDDGIKTLRSSARRKAVVASRRTRSAIASRRYGELVLALGAWLAAPASRANAYKPDDNLLSYAAGLLQQRHRRLRKRAKKLEALSDKERHEVRIATKQLRYAAGFFGILYPGERTGAYLAGLEGLQDSLGTLNDIAVARDLIDELTGTTPSAAEQRAAVLARRWLTRRKRAVLKEMTTAWHTLRRAKHFWSK